jgi:hypothetical protein
MVDRSALLKSTGARSLKQKTILFLPEIGDIFFPCAMHDNMLLIKIFGGICIPVAALSFLNNLALANRNRENRENS